VTAFALPYLAAARLSGPDAQTFLQAQLSADIARLEDGGATFACYCSPRGQVLGLLLVCRADDDYLVIGSASLLPGILQRLRLFVLRARVQLALAPEWVVCGLEDPEASAAAGAFRPPGSDLAWGLLSGGEPSAPGAERWKEMERLLSRPGDRCAGKIPGPGQAQAAGPAG
jgi:folate-binding Fe-S cluster repair protein YgfZ